MNARTNSTPPPRRRRRRRTARTLLTVAVAASLLTTHAPLGRAAVARAQEAGGIESEAVPPHVEAAVDKALDWLARNQMPDGRFPQGGDSTTAISSLAVMAFLARGHVPGQGPYGEVLNKSIDYVVEHQKENGILSAASSNAVMYEHGISAAMLGEVYGMVDDERRTKIDKVLARAVKVILDAQKLPDGPHKGGWRYSPTARDADISVTGWQLMALRGAANSGASVPKGALDDGVEYVRRCAVPSGGFCYQPGGPPNAARTGTGILSMVMLGQHTAERPNPEAVRGGEWLIEHPPKDPNSEFYFYAIYYCSQSLYQLGGKYWDGVYPQLREPLMKLQQPDGHFAGGNGQEAQAGDAYRTSMAVLALCVPYRYLPLYQR